MVFYAIAGLVDAYGVDISPHATFDLVTRLFRYIYTGVTNIFVFKVYVCGYIYGLYGPLVLSLIGIFFDRFGGLIYITRVLCGLL